MKHFLTTMALTLALAVSGCGDDGDGVDLSDAGTTDAGETSGPGTFTPAPDASAPFNSGVPCAGDGDCAGFEDRDCFAAQCDTDTGTCRSVLLPHGSLCKYGLECWEPGTCVDGVCLGASVEPKDCGIAECGTDACGNSCGKCKGDRYCHDGSCVLPCGDLTLEGCCDTFMGISHLHYCIDGRVISAGCPDGCGWNTSGNYYECNYVGPEPSGAYPIECPDMDYYGRALDE